MSPNDDLFGIRITNSDPVFTRQERHGCLAFSTTNNCIVQRSVICDLGYNCIIDGWSRTNYVQDAVELNAIEFQAERFQIT